MAAEVILRVNKNPVLLQIVNRPVVLAVKAGRGSNGLNGSNAVPGFGTFVQGMIESNEYILRYQSRGSFPLDPAKCVASVDASDAPGANWIAHIHINGVLHGSITFLSGQTTGTFVFDVPSLADNDIIQVYAANPADFNMKNLTLEFFS